MLRLIQRRLGIDNVLSREALEARSDKVTSSPNMIVCVGVPPPSRIAIPEINCCVDPFSDLIRGKTTVPIWVIDNMPT